MVTHECPAVSCAELVDHTKLACPRHWYWLPPALRNRVWSAYRNRASDPRGHADAVAEAMAWYRAHPDGRVKNPPAG